jgi:hypothetical protein
MKVEDGIYRVLVGLKRKAINRDGLDHFFQKRQRGIDILMPVEWDKTSGKQLRYGLARREWRQHIA